MSNVRGQVRAHMAVVMDRALRGETGQGLSEYAVVVAGVALVVLFSLYSLGGKLAVFFDNIGKTFGS